MCLFYTQVNNYSLYAYNAQELTKENYKEKCWINGIFHKNDGYQTPIVLNPWREDGNININKERGLAKDRLISLFVSDENFRNINHNQHAELLTYSLLPDSKSKLDNKSICDFFKNTQTSIDISIKFEDKFHIKKLRRKTNTSINKLLAELLSALESLSQFIQKEKDIIDRAIAIKRKLINDIRDERKEETNWLPNPTDIQLINDLLDNKIHHLDKSLSNLQKEMEYIEELNSTQFMRVVLIACFRDEWKNYLEKLTKWRVSFAKKS